MTPDQKQEIRRNHAASTIRQLATILDELSSNALDALKRQDYQAGARALRQLANDVAEGKVNPRRWEFLTWIAEPKDLDCVGLPVSSAVGKSSG